MHSTFPFLHLWSVEIEDDQLFLVQDTKPFSVVIQATTLTTKDYSLTLPSAGLQLSPLLSTLQSLA